MRLQKTRANILKPALARGELQCIGATTLDEYRIRSRLDALQFDLVNTEIKSPANGLVMGLTVHTVGGVVAAGSPMMEVVPKNEVLKIEAQIPPHLIDKVKPGLAVDILFTALNQVTTPRIEGKVVWVSADVLIEPTPVQSLRRSHTRRDAEAQTE